MIGHDISLFVEVGFIVVICYVKSLYLLKKQKKKKHNISLLRYVGFVVVFFFCFFFLFLKMLYLLKSK